MDQRWPIVRCDLPKKRGLPGRTLRGLLSEGRVRIYAHMGRCPFTADLRHADSPQARSSTALTHVELTLVEKRVVRFGRMAKDRVIDQQHHHIPVKKMGAESAFALPQA